MASFTLDDIRSAADAKYGSTDIELGEGETIVLLNPLRLPKHKRDRIKALQDQLTAEAELDENGEEIESKDQELILSDMFRIVAKSERQAERLIDALDGDLAAMVTVFEKYSEDTSAGEASASQD